MLLRIFIGALTCLLTGYLTTQFSAIVLSQALEMLACNASLTLAKGYLMKNGRGFYPEKNTIAIAMEASYRTRVIIAGYVFTLILVLLLFPSSLTVWIIPKWSFKIGIIIGLLFDGLMSLAYSAFTEAQIGLLESIDENGVGHFNCPNRQTEIEFSFADYWTSEEYPPTNVRYMFIRYLSHSGFISLSYSDT